MKPSPDPGAPRPAYLALLLSLVPGLGHLILARSRRGLLLFLAGSGGWNLALVSYAGPVPPLGDWTFRTGVIIGVAVTAFAVIDLFRIGVYARWTRVRHRRREFLRQGIRCYLRQDFPAARGYLDRLLDLDSGDATARLYLASLERRAGRMDRALRHARKALRANPRNRFHPELEREIEMVRELNRGR